MSDETTSVEPPAAPLTVEERLIYLEEQNEGLKRVGKLLLGLCIVTAVLLAWTQSSMRSAVYSEAMIFGNSDAPRATLTTTPNGHLGMLFYDHMGILPPNPQFNAIPYLDGFAIYDRTGKPRIVIGVNDKDEAVVDVLSPEGKLLFSAGHPDRPGAASAGQPSPTGVTPTPGTPPPPASATPTP